MTIVDVVTGISTVVLVLVTAYYAKKTKDMADTASEAAADSARATAAAEKAALAARDTAAIAQSQVRVEFTARTVAVYRGEAEWDSALVIQSEADAVVVRKVQVVRAFRESQRNELNAKAELEGLTLMPFNGESQLPRRLHQDEDLVVTHKRLQDQGLDLFETYILHVDYTFTEDGTAGGTRRLRVTR